MRPLFRWGRPAASAAVALAIGMASATFSSPGAVQAQGCPVPGAAPTVFLDDASIGEGGTNRHRMHLSEPTPYIVTVGYQALSGSADVNVDFVGGVILFHTFNPCETSTNINVPTIQDQHVEGTEFYNLSYQVMSPTAVRDRDVARGNIIDDDPDPTVSVEDASTTEGPTARLRFVVHLTRPAAEDVFVDYQTFNGSARVTEDYNGAVGTLKFSIGEQQKNVDVTVLDDQAVEGTENMFLRLLDARGDNVTRADSEAVGTIQDNDTRVEQTVTVDDASVVEGDRVKLTFIVRLARPAAEEVNVDYRTVEDSARATVDYFSAIGTLHFARGEQSKTVDVTVVDDKDIEGNETLRFRLTAVRGDDTRIARSDAKGTIIDNDVLTVSITHGAAQEGDNGFSEIPFTVMLSDGAPSSGVTVKATSSPGTAIGDRRCPHEGGAAGADYEDLNFTVVFESRQFQKSFVVRVCGDRNVEQNEVVTVQLSNAVNASIGQGTATGFIRNDDHAPALPGNPQRSPNAGTLGQNVPGLAQLVQLNVAPGQYEVLLRSNLKALLSQSLKAGVTVILRDGTKLIGMDGATLIGMDGATLIGMDGATLIGPDGGTFRIIGGHVVAMGTGLGGMTTSNSFIVQNGADLISDKGWGLIPRSAADLISDKGWGFIPIEGPELGGS